MARNTIDFGIDLGTTNSAVAVLKGARPEVFRNNQGFEYTPSAVYIDPKGKLQVGRAAKERTESDPENAYAEFKGRMGENYSYVFERSGRRFTPPQLSAEVLKSLKGDVEQRTGESIRAAVITIPAAFELPQCRATREAAELAGFVESPLLLEPSAAALAYGFQSESERVFWLVYDFGGGTFDASLVHMRDSSIEVVNHGGDNELGGKHIDWAIVEQSWIPTLTKDRRFAGLRRYAGKEWLGTLAKLKWLAEGARMDVSREQSVDIVETLNDSSGNAVPFECEFTRKDLERLWDPFIMRSVNICRKVMAERRLGPSDIEKLLLVGGPTLTPYLRTRLAEEIGIPLEFDKDPLTVVAQGAAVFAATQRLTGGSVMVPAVAGQFDVHLEYKPVGADTEPLVGGRVSAPDGADFSGFTIEFANLEARPEWRSGKIGLSPSGGFMTNLWAEKGRMNTFSIELRDRTGRLQTTVPNNLTYMVGIAISETQLPHSMGVALANNDVDALFKKGSSIPDRRKTVLSTVADARRDQGGHVIRIPIVEGENRRADRNQVIGSLEIRASELKRDLPAGTRVELTIEIDASSQVQASAYIEVLDQDFVKVINFEAYRQSAKTPSELKADLERQRQRLDQARRRAATAAEQRADQALQRIDSERMLYAAEGALEAARGDADAASQCQRRLIELQSTIDEVEDAVEWPALVAEAEKEIEVERRIINDPTNKATGDERANFAALEREIREAFTGRDVDVLRRKISEIDRLGLVIMFRRPEFWMAQFHQLEQKRQTMSNQAQADQFLNHGRRAINNNDVEGLRSAVQQLYGLLPADDKDRRISDVSKK